MGEQTLEVVYTWPDGRDEVHYRRTPADGPEAAKLMKEVEENHALCEIFQTKSPYSIRIV